MPLVLVIVQRLFNALPLNSNRTLQYLAADEVLEQGTTILLGIARYELQVIIAELVLVLNQTLTYPPRKEGLMDTQLYLMRLISQCIENADQGFKKGELERQIFDSATVTQLLACYFKIAISATVNAEATTVDLPSPSKPSRFGRPTSQLLSRPTSQVPPKSPMYDGRRKSSQEISRPTLQFVARKSSELSIISSRNHEEMQRHFKVLLTFVSSTNWPATFEFVGCLLRQPYFDDEEETYNKKLHLLSYLAIDQFSLDPLLLAAGDAFSALLKSSQLELIGSLHFALGSWIAHRPQEISDVREVLQGQDLDSGLQLLDLLTIFLEASSQKRKGSTWPLMSILRTLYTPELGDDSHNRKHKKDTLIKDLKTAMLTNKTSTACLESYTYMLSIISHFTPLEKERCKPLTLQILRDISSSMEVFNDSVEKESFVMAPSLISALFRLNLDESLQIVRSTLDHWLNKVERTSLRTQAIQCVAAIFADETQCAHGRGRDELLRLASHSIKMPFLTPSSAGFGGNIGPDLSESVLEMLCTAPQMILAEQEHAVAMQSILEACVSHQRLSTGSAGHLILELQSPSCIQGEIFGKQFHQEGVAFLPLWCKFSAKAIEGIIARLLALEPIHVEEIMKMLELLAKCMSRRVATLTEYQDELGKDTDVSLHESMQEALEVALLRYSCHVNFTVATRAAEACSSLVEESEVYQRLRKPRHGLRDNKELYLSMARETFLTPGRNAVQKKIRNRLRSAHDTPALRKAWLAVFALWSKLTDSLFGVRNINAIQGQEASLEWQNYTGFLAALARVEGSNHEDPVYAFISRFKEVFVQAQTEFISEICAEIIGNALHISLYTPMLQEVQKLISTMKDRKGVLIVRSRSTITMEQLILICRGLFERLESFLAFQEGLNVGEIMIDLAQYLQLCGQAYIRSRLRFCQLCEIFAARYDLMCILGETSVRRRLCNYLGKWISLTETTSTDLERITKDTNAACLRALARLTRDLPFGYEKASSGRQLAGDIKSLLQIVLPLSSMSAEEALRFSSAPLRPILIDLLSNAITANQRSAISSFISLCYHGNVNVGATFTSTIARSLKMDSVVIFKSLELADIEGDLWQLVTTDASALTALLDGCPIQDGPLDMLVQVCQGQGQVLSLFALLLDTEIAICDQETELFRRNSSTTRLFALYAARCGGSYVQDTLKQPLARLADRVEDHSMELDRTKLPGSVEEDLDRVLSQNQAHLISACQEFIDAICNSISCLPSELKDVMALVGYKTARRYPDAVQKSVGSFLILRLVGPYIVKSAKGSQKLQRQLILIVKILTNLANNTYFKEGHLMSLNPFLRANVPRLSQLLQVISEPSSMDTYSQNEIVLSKSSLPKLYPYFQQNADRIRNKLIEIHLKQGRSVETLRDSTHHIRKLLCHLVEPETHKVSSAQFMPPDDNVKTTAFLNVSIPEVQHVFRQVGTSHSRRSLYYMELGKFKGMSLSAILTLCAEVRSHMSDMARVDAEILLDITGFSVEGLSDNPDLHRAIRTTLFGHEFPLYVYNANQAFIAYMSKHNNSIWIDRAPSTVFIDHTDPLEDLFDPAVCLYLASTHGLLVKTYPHDLFCTNANQDDKCAIRLILMSDDTILLSNIEKTVVANSLEARLVEQIIVKHVQETRVEGDALCVVMRDQQVHRLCTVDPRREMEVLELFLAKAIEQFNSDSHESVEALWALVVCVGLIKISSTDPLSRDSGGQILLQVLPDHELQRFGMLSIAASAITSLNPSELRELHALSHRDASILSRITFLDEVLSRLPYLAHTERRTTLPCLDIWLGDISIMAHTSTQFADIVRRILLSLLNLHSPSDDSRLSLELWSSLGAQESLQELLFEHLTSYACLYQHESRQVLKVSQIFRIIGLSDTLLVSRLSKDLVKNLENKVHKSGADLSLFDSWTTIHVLLRLLVDLTARNASVVESLPEIMYIFTSLHNLGSIELRALSYHLFLNSAAASACKPDLAVSKRAILLNVVGALQQPDFKQMFAIPLAELPDYFNRSVSSGTPRHRFLSAAEHYSKLASLVVSSIRQVATDSDHESAILERYSRLIMSIILQLSPMRRRAYVLLGHISAELGLTTVQPLVHALQLELVNSTESSSKESVAIVISLGLTNSTELPSLLRLSLALCVIPMTAVASAGLHLLLQCLSKLSHEKNGFTALMNKLTADHTTWVDLQSLIGIKNSPNAMLFLASLLLQSLKLTRDKHMIKNILRQILVLHASGPSVVAKADLAPLLMILCSLSESSQEMSSILALVGLQDEKDSRRCDQSLHELFTGLQITDDNIAVPTLCIMMTLLASAETTEDQIKAIKILAVAARYLPRAFQMIYDDMAAYLRSVLQRSNHLPLLKAVQQIIISEKRLQASPVYRRSHDSASDKDVVLAQLGYHYYTREWSFANEGQQESAIKKCISSMIQCKET